VRTLSKTQCRDARDAFCRSGPKSAADDALRVRFFEALRTLL